MMHRKNIALLLLLYSIFHSPQTLTAASSPTKKGDADKPPQKSLNQTVSLVTDDSNSISGDGKDEVKLPAAQETCESASKKCHVDAMNVTACIFPYAGDGPVALLVLNDGDGSLKFNYTIPPSESTSEYIEIEAHKVKKINISDGISSATSAVLLKADNRTCTIQLQVLPQPPPPPSPPPPPLPPSLPSYSYAEYATPVNGIYLLLAIALLTGLIWGCCKLRKKTRNGDVPYQQLEMGKKKQESTSSIDMETGGGGWDQDWDDDWDEDKAVRSPGGNHIGNSGSGIAETNGWEDDWKV